MTTNRPSWGPRCRRCVVPGSTLSRPCVCPLVCDCLVAQPQLSGQCARCFRRVAALMSPDNYNAALAAYPELAGQTIDWTFRTAKAVS